MLDEVRAVLARSIEGAPGDLDASIGPTPPHVAGVYGTSVALRICQAGDPQAVARAIARGANQSPGRRLTEARPVGPYVVFSIADVGAAVEEVARSATTPFCEGAGRSAIVEAAPPNIGASFTALHYRASCIATFLASVFDALGYSATRLLFWNDCGAPAAKAMAQQVDLGDERHLAWALDRGSPSIVAMWRRFRDERWRGLERVYRRHGFVFDSVVPESQHLPSMASLRDALIASGIASRDGDGSVVASFARPDLGRRVLFRSDGASLYLARDLAELARRARLDPAHNVYVVSRNQAQHFRQLFTLGQQLGLPLAERSRHAAFGFVRPSTAAPDEVLDALRRRAGATAAEASAALKLMMFGRVPARDVDLDLDVMARSDLRQARHLLAVVRSDDRHWAGGSGSHDLGADDITLLRLLDSYGNALSATARHLNPSILVRHAFAVARALRSRPASHDAACSAHTPTLSLAAAELVRRIATFAGFVTPDGART